MNTRKKVPRPQKTPAVSADIVAPVVTEAAAPSPKRVQVGKAIGINIAVARARRHLDKLTTNAGPCAYIDAIREQLAPYNAAQKQLKTGKITHLVEKDYQYIKDGKTLTGKKIFEEDRDLTDAERASAQKVIDTLAPSVPAWEAKLEAFSRERSRFSSDAPVALAVICDELTNQLVAHAIGSTIAAKKKTVHTVHIYGQGVESLSLYPLVSGLTTFKQTAASISEEQHRAAAAAALASALKQAEKDFKKKYEVRVKRVKKADAPEAAPTEPEVETIDKVEDEDDESGSSFKMYVGQACKDVVDKNEAFKTIRFSTEVRDHLSALLIEFIQRVSSLVSISVRTVGTKTITCPIIMSAIESLLIEGHAKVEKIELVSVKVPSAEALKADAAAKAKAKADGVEFAPTELPLVDSFEVARTVSYPTSGFDDLHKVVTDKLAAFAALPKNVKKPKSEEEADLINDLVA